MDENGVIDLTTDPTLYLDSALKAEFYRLIGKYLLSSGAYSAEESTRRIQGGLCSRQICRKTTVE
jgi:hypothetical protein